MFVYRASRDGFSFHVQDHQIREYAERGYTIRREEVDGGPIDDWGDVMGNSVEITDFDSEERAIEARMAVLNSLINVVSEAGMHATTEEVVRADAD